MVLGKKSLLDPVLVTLVSFLFLKLALCVLSSGLSISCSLLLECSPAFRMVGVFSQGLIIMDKTSRKSRTVRLYLSPMKGSVSDPWIKRSDFRLVPSCLASKRKQTFWRPGSALDSTDLMVLSAASANGCASPVALKILRRWRRDCVSHLPDSREQRQLQRLFSCCFSHTSVPL